MSRALVWPLVPVLLLLGAIAPAVQADPGGVATTHFYLFVPGDDELGAGPVLMLEGTELHYANLDPAPHSLTSVALKQDGSWLFDSGVVALGGTAPVAGTAELSPGDYPFMCSVHPALMRGMLRVLARPV